MLWDRLEDWGARTTRSSTSSTSRPPIFANSRSAGFPAWQSTITERCSAMTKLIVFGAALVLTFPLYLGITAISWLAAWFAHGSGWDVFSPVFRILGSVGGEQDESMLLAMLLLASFLISLAATAFAARIIERWRRSPKRTSP